MAGDLGCVYLVTCLPTGKRYVGMTQRDATGKLRWVAHLELASSGYRGLLHRAIRKYGKDNFRLEVLAVRKTLKSLQKSERFFIKKLDTLAPRGFNCTEGGLGGRAVLSARKKIGKASAGRWKTKEFRNRMLPVLQRNNLESKSPERREQARSRRLGRKHTKETKAKISRANKRRWKLGGDLRNKWN